MYNYFYNYHNRPLAWDLFNRSTEDGTPPPITSVERITQDGIERITEDSIERVTE